MSVEAIKLWFNRAAPAPTEKQKNVQIGVHIEEFAEMLETLKGNDSTSDMQIGLLQDLAKHVAMQLKQGTITVSVKDRKEFLDSLADQIVTAVGCGHMHDMNIVKALDAVNSSNWSKFDKDGQPIFDKNGKIAKGPDYRKPNLEGFY